ncbi:UDP-sugar pyrophosphorylase [Trypanosoma theileri]|uniref:UTP-monosaccharide-1-phosphate uridylyltransferase n=1 Tax=Trypanosoma theileri TaxID=67003 RepID=A0A1X0NSQ3_9TRYP|nr:UDP-sugar pyrophosphorylase [Trypanosoma theileri]ORC87736.1 UDP-sugar pyrophosphorylase [Trypanosoma theileri]
MTSPTMSDLQGLRELLSSPELGQQHLFNGWPNTPEEYNEEQKQLLKELWDFGRHYDGGVPQYIRTGKRLLAGIQTPQSDIIGLNQPTYAYNAPSLIPEEGDAHTSEKSTLMKMEREGLQLLQRSIIVLVAGGLGERLGFAGVKVGLPVETATHHCYLSHYLSWFRQCVGKDAPFVIMTSDDTHERTKTLLQELNHGMNNIHLLKQEMVFCFGDTAAHLAMENGKLLRKPHGHGDVHSLLYQATNPNSGKRLVDQWMEEGYEYIVFMQDTNAMSTLTIPVSLSMSAQHKLSMNFTCIPRIPKEAIGLLCNVRTRESDMERTVNIEYNLFESVAASLIKGGGDSAAPGSPYSPFPGSINTLVLNFKDYVPLLTQSRGTVPEFINPKFTDETKTKFKPCRIESLMQDVALLFDPSKHRVGATTFTRLTYQPVKNALLEGVKKTLQGLDAHCAATGEEGFYEIMRQRFQSAGLKLPSRLNDAFDVEVANTLKVRLFPIIVADAMAMGVSLEEITQRLLPHPEKVKISERSVLIVEGRVRIESLTLDGALRLVGPVDESAAPLVIRDLTVKNNGWSVRPTREGVDTKEIDKIRGFIFEEHEMQTVNYAKL